MITESPCNSESYLEISGYIGLCGWHKTQNLLEISATHDSIKRYLGPEPNYEGQEKLYFRVLLAEIVTESVCRKALGLEFKNRPMDFKEDFAGNPEVVVDTILTRLQQRICEFVAIAHKCMLDSAEIK